MLAASFVAGITPDEFERLYSAPEKDAATCYELYRAFSQGDGVQRDDTQARKWLLAAYSSGMSGARREIATLPWRREKGILPSIEVADVDDATAQQKGQELLDLLLADVEEKYGTQLLHVKLERKPEVVARVRELIAAGADLNMAAEKGGALHTPLSIAVRFGDLKLAKLLIENGADPCAYSSLALLRCLVPYVRNALEEPPSFADAEEGEMRLRKPTAQLHARTPQQQLSLEILDFLIRHGLDTGMWTEYGWSLAAQVIERHGLLALEPLIAAGMDVNMPQRPEECVSSALPPDKLKHYVEYGYVEERVSPICFAVLHLSDIAVEQFVRLGADITRSSFGKSLLQLAHEEIARSNSREYAARGVLMMRALEKAFRREREEREDDDNDVMDERDLETDDNSDL